MGNIEIIDEIFMALAKYGWNNKMVFKGAWVLSNLMPNEARLTHDIDGSLEGLELWEQFKDTIKIIGNEYLNDIGYSIIEYREPIIGKRSAGITIKSKGKESIGIDISIDDTSYGVIVSNIRGIETHIFSPERMLGDKISAMYSKQRFRRVKDLYDIYIMIHRFNIRSTEIMQCLTKRKFFERINESPFRQEVATQLEHAWDKLEIYSSRAGNIDLEKPDFTEVMRAFSLFVVPLVRLCDIKDKEEHVFNSEKMRWD